MNFLKDFINAVMTPPWQRAVDRKLLSLHGQNAVPFVSGTEIMADAACETHSALSFTAQHQDIMVHLATKISEGEISVKYYAKAQDGKRLTEYMNSLVDLPSNIMDNGQMRALEIGQDVEVVYTLPDTDLNAE